MVLQETLILKISFVKPRTSLTVHCIAVRISKVISFPIHCDPWFHHAPFINHRALAHVQKLHLPPSPHPLQSHHRRLNHYCQVHQTPLHVPNFHLTSGTGTGSRVTSVQSNAKSLPFFSPFVIRSDSGVVEVPLANVVSFPPLQIHTWMTPSFPTLWWSTSSCKFNFGDPPGMELQERSVILW